MNNATRFSSDGAVTVRFHVAGPAVARVEVANAVDDEQRAWLAERLAADPGAPYRAGVTRGGSGLGLANAASFVAAAFGLDEPDDAAAGRYLGGRLVGGRYRAWFHWPTYG